MARLGRSATVAVELLYFEGCPHWRRAAAAIADAARATGVRAEVHATGISNPEDAVRRRFLGSPTVRVAGRDVEPGAGERSEYALACRVYDSGTGRAWSPPIEWIARLASRGRGHVSPPSLLARRPPLAALLYGLLLAGMAAGQLASLDVFENALASYELLGGLLPAAVIGVPALEVLAALGLLGSRLLPRRAVRTAGVLGVVVAIVWSLLAVQAFARGLAVENCGCFGAYLAQELRWWVLLEDAYQLLLAFLAARSLDVLLPGTGGMPVSALREAPPEPARR